jgi:tetratricopeptide (TPR) repeat protein
MIGTKFIAVILLVLVASHGIGQQHQQSGDITLGEVHFATSCNDPAQNEVNRAVALLHSFDFGRAIAAFKAALGRDETCAIAYWGIALSDWGNPFAPGITDKRLLQLGRENAERGELLGGKTDRERAYVVAVGNLYKDFESTPQKARILAYRNAMRDLQAKYPEDHEATIFYALALAVAADREDKTYADQLEAGRILEKLFVQEPTHPGLAHYIIHAYDVPALAAQALKAAQLYSEIAPDAPHALHMPSHTFTRLGYWQASIDSNATAAAAARRQGQTAEELHASDYETYAYLQTAQDEAAGRIVRSVPEIASRFDPNALLIGAGPPAAGYFALAAIPARYALERRDWQRAEQLALKETPFPFTDAVTWFARGLGAARIGHTAAANEASAALKVIQERLVSAKEMYWARQVEIQALAVAAWSALAMGAKEEALRQMKSAAEMEDATEKSAVTPGPLSPARELLGEMFLELNEPAKALDQFEATLKKEPRRFRSLYGAAHAAQLIGSTDTSQRYFLELLDVCAHADKSARPELKEARDALANPGPGAARRRQGAPASKIAPGDFVELVIGGEGEIRTRETRESLPVFKTGAFNRSATSPLSFYSTGCDCGTAHYL